MIPRTRRRGGAESNLVDGRYYGLGPLTNIREVANLEHKKQVRLEQPAVTPLREKAVKIEELLRDVAKELEQLPKPQMFFAGTVHYGSGNFSGTDGGKPRVIHVLSRGDVRKPKAEVGPGALPLFLLCRHGSISRRRWTKGAAFGLARWISDPRNPLTWRSIVNRVWQYHFGRGLVDTPNDFGRMGQKPTHPELLDWLAAEFRDHGQSLKQLHRLIVTSAVYRQSCADRAEAAEDRCPEQVPLANESQTTRSRGAAGRRARRRRNARPHHGRPGISGFHHRKA